MALRHKPELRMGLEARVQASRMSRVQATFDGEVDAYTTDFSQAARYGAQRETVRVEPSGAAAGARVTVRAPVDDTILAFR